MEEDKYLEGIIIDLGKNSGDHGHVVALLIKDKENIFHDECLYCRNEESQKAYSSLLKKNQKVKLFSYDEGDRNYHKIQILE